MPACLYSFTYLPTYLLSGLGLRWLSSGLSSISSLALLLSPFVLLIVRPSLCCCRGACVVLLCEWIVVLCVVCLAMG